MKIAILSDIHANAPALRSVLSAIQQDDVQRIICLGDIVGFHTEPGECIDILIEHRIDCLAGNHDAGVVGKLSERHFPGECWEAIQWTRQRLSREHISFLRTLVPMTVIDRRFMIMHGFLGSVRHYLVGAWRMRLVALRIKMAGVSVGFYGHTHAQSIHSISQSLYSVFELEPANHRLASGLTYLINPGTVGQPRMNDVRASYCVYDEGAGTVDFCKVRYDYEGVVRKTLAIFPSHSHLYRHINPSP